MREGKVCWVQISNKCWQRKSPDGGKRVAEWRHLAYAEQIMQTLREGDGFFSLPAERGADARGRFRGVTRGKIWGAAAGAPASERASGAAGGEVRCGVVQSGVVCCGVQEPVPYLETRTKGWKKGIVEAPLSPSLLLALPRSLSRTCTSILGICPTLPKSIPLTAGSLTFTSISIILTDECLLLINK